VDLGNLQDSKYTMDSGTSESRISDHFFDLNAKAIGHEEWL
jgi:hypothetical protein